MMFSCFLEFFFHLRNIQTILDVEWEINKFVFILFAYFNEIFFPHCGIKLNFNTEAILNFESFKLINFDLFNCFIFSNDRIYFG